MKVKVYHVRHLSVPQHIATVEAPYETHEQACEYAFRWTQNIEDSWSKKMPRDGNDAVIVEVPVSSGRGHRSTMAGDVFEVEGQRYMCAPIGFTLMK